MPWTLEESCTGHFGSMGSISFGLFTINFLIHNKQKKNNILILTDHIFHKKRWFNKSKMKMYLNWLRHICSCKWNLYLGWHHWATHQRRERLLFLESWGRCLPDTSPTANRPHSLKTHRTGMLCSNYCCVTTGFHTVANGLANAPLRQPHTKANAN